MEAVRGYEISGEDEAAADEGVSLIIEDSLWLGISIRLWRRRERG
jgi:hypothetical protein